MLPINKESRSGGADGMTPSMTPKKSRRVSNADLLDYMRRHAADYNLTPGLIPKIVHQIWVGGEIPPVQALYMKRWREMKGWKHVLWGNEDITRRNFPSTYDSIQRALAVGRELGRNKYAQVSDLMRFEIIYRYGGVYVDSTVEPVKSLDSLFDDPEVSFVVANEQPGCGLDCGAPHPYVSTGFFASVALHPVLERCLSPQSLAGIDFYNPKVNVETGPYFFRKNMRPKSDRITLVPTRLVYPVPYTANGETKCFRKRPFRGSNLTLTDKSGDTTYYLRYPCDRYPDAYMVRTWQIGGTWL